jgi:hypothetical protein
MSPALRRRLAIDGSAIVLLALTGPFGTFVELSGPLRLAYWGIAVAGCSIFMHLAVGRTLTAPWLAGWPRAPRMALGAMVAAVPGAALIGVLEVLLRQDRDVFRDYFWLWFCVSAVGFAVAFFQFRLFAQASPVAEAVGARFLERLPRDIGRDIVSLSMQDHYVEVITDRGSTMILIRFAEAVRELEGYPGARVHRSHWVAAGRSNRIFRERNRILIELTDGRRLPVSRPYLEDARKLIGNVGG